jgi:nucleoside-diphosphate-sugar epimerase
VAAIALFTSPPGTVSTKLVARKISYDFFDLNVRGTFEVFEAAVSLGIDKIVFISTSVYRPDTRRAQQDSG